MALERLAQDILASAESEAGEIIAEAKKEAKSILDEAKARAKSILDSSESQSSKEANQISKEIVASARQSNQKEILVAQKTELDTAYEMAKTKLSDASLKGRASLLKHLLSEAKKVGEGKMVLRPTTIDRSALEDASKDYSIGEEVDGMGGFILEAADGSISFDYRFDGLLEEAWSTLLPKITGELF